MTEIANYDTFGYDYSEYWKERRYENEAEKTLLAKIFSNYSGRWFLDIGGSYGRLTSTYYNRYTNPVILDYSLATLQKNYKTIKSKYPNAELIAANAYKMPFRQDSFDGALMVRVLHHIEKPEEYFDELKRIMGNKSIYVQEFANKVHIKAKVKALLKQDFKFFDTKPYQQPSAQNFEGTKTGEEALFYNYHPKHIKNELQNRNFEIKKKHGCSYLRSQKLKNVLGEDNMLAIEKVLQNTLSWSNIPPSVIYETILRKDSAPKHTPENLKEILRCPACHAEMNFSDTLAKCLKCNKEYFKQDNVWDFRID